MPRGKPTCNIREHHDKMLRGGKRCACAACADIFPCRHECDHADCMIATGRTLPDWIVPVDDGVELSAVTDAVFARAR